VIVPVNVDHGMIRVSGLHFRSRFVGIEPKAERSLGGIAMRKSAARAKPRSALVLSGSLFKACQIVVALDRSFVGVFASLADVAKGEMGRNLLCVRFILGRS